MRCVKTIRDLGVVSSTTGMVNVRDFNTISIGFSMMVSIGLIGLIVACVSSAFEVFMVASVMSANAAIGFWEDSGDFGGFGCGVGGSSGTDEMELRAALLRFRGGGMVAGEDVGSGLIVESASKTSLVSAAGDGVGVFLGRPRGLGVLATEGAGVVDLRGPLVVLLAGLGSGSKSSSSSWTLERLETWETSSSSSESIMAVRLVARRGLTGDDILEECTCHRQDENANNSM